MASEKEFETEVKEFLNQRGCWYLKTWSNGIQRKGIPDLLICCNGLFLGVELKAMNGKPSDLQKREIKRIRKSNGIGIVLYPDCFEQFKTYIDELLDKEIDNEVSYDWIFENL